MRKENDRRLLHLSAYLFIHQPNELGAEKERERREEREKREERENDPNFADKARDGYFINSIVILYHFLTIYDY